MPTHRTVWLACALCALAATAASGQGSTSGALPRPKNDSRQQREDSLKADAGSVWPAAHDLHQPGAAPSSGAQGARA
jgi:hypothetical protein